MPNARFLLLLLLPGCFYATKGQYDEAFDRDGDTWPLGDDCAPDDPLIYPGAPDFRGDGCDADCGVELDTDGDDWPDDADCDPTDPAIHPCAEDIAGDGIDQDCDNTDGPRDTECPTGPADATDLGATCANPSVMP